MHRKQVELFPVLNLFPEQEFDKFPCTFLMRGIGIDCHGIQWIGHHMAAVVKQGSHRYKPFFLLLCRAAEMEIGGHIYFMGNFLLQRSSVIITVSSGSFQQFLKEGCIEIAAARLPVHHSPKAFRTLQECIQQSL